MQNSTVHNLLLVTHLSGMVAYQTYSFVPLYIKTVLAGNHHVSV